MAAGFSIFDISQAAWPTSWRASFTSSPRCTNDSATQSTPRRSAKSRSFLSFSVSGPIGSTVSGRLMPLRLASVPPTSTVASMLERVLLDHAHADLAVVEQQRVAGLDRLEDLRMRQEHALRPAVALRACRSGRWRPRSARRARRRSCRRGTSAPAGRRGCRSAARSWPRRCARPRAPSSPGRRRSGSC